MLMLNRVLTAFSMLLITAATFAATNDFTLKSSTYSDNSKFPVKYTCNGDHISPPLSWSHPPANTKSYLLIFASPDWSAGPGTIYLWVVYNIPASTTSLAAGANKELPEGALVGTNWYSEAGYRGPCPPDDLVHHYIFTVYALDSFLDLSAGEDAEAVLDRAQPHILKQAKLVGTFSH